MTFVLGAILLTGAVVFFVLHPILSGRGAPTEGERDELTEAEARRRVTLLALRDVEYDRATGKLDDADYRSLRRELSQEALAALEAEEAERREVPAGTPGARPGRAPADVETEIARVREGLRSGLTCLVCGHLNASGSRFCSSCGSPLEAAAAQGNGAAR